MFSGYIHCFPHRIMYWLLKTTIPIKFKALSIVNSWENFQIQFFFPNFRTKTTPTSNFELCWIWRQRWSLLYRRTPPSPVLNFHPWNSHPVYEAAHFWPTQRLELSLYRNLSSGLRLFNGYFFRYILHGYSRGNCVSLSRGVTNSVGTLYQPPKKLYQLIASRQN